MHPHMHAQTTHICIRDGLVYAALLVEGSNLGSLICPLLNLHFALCKTYGQGPGLHHGRCLDLRYGLHCTVRRGPGLQVDVFKEIISLRALHLDWVTWRRLNSGRGNIGALMRRLRPLTNLEEMSLTVQRTTAGLADYPVLCSFWERSGDLMAKDMRSLRRVQVISDAGRSSFKLG